LVSNLDQKKGNANASPFLVTGTNPVVSTLAATTKGRPVLAQL